MNKNEVFENVLTEWGWEHQSTQLVNAMGGLISAITQIHINIFFEKPSDFDGMVAGLAAVQLKLDGLKYELTEAELDVWQREYNRGLEETKKQLETTEECHDGPQ